MSLLRRLIPCTLLAALAATAFAQPPATPAAPAKTDAPAKAEQPKPAAAEEKLPTPQEIHEKFIQACGGREANEKIKARVITATLEIQPMGMKGKMSIKLLAPNKGLTSGEIEGIGKIDQGTDGTYAWETNAITGSRLLEGAERDEVIRSLSMQSELKLFETYPQSKTIGSAKVADKDTYKVELTSAKGEKVVRYYEKESALLVKQEQSVKNPMGEIKTESTIGDYKPVNGVLVAHSTKIDFQGLQQMTTTIDKVEMPDTIDEAEFKPSAEVQQLIDEAKKAAEKTPEDKKPEADKPAEPKPEPKK